MVRRPKVRFFFAWFDLWVGGFWSGKSRTLYVCFLPMVVLAFTFGPALPEDYPELRRRLRVSQYWVDRFMGDLAATAIEGAVLKARIAELEAELSGSNPSPKRD